MKTTINQIGKLIRLYPQRVIFFTPFLISLLVYGSTAARYSVGYGDSDELITVGYVLGVAHPPGYPIHTLLTFLFTHIPGLGNPVYSAHLMSSFIQAIAIGILSLVFYQLLSVISKTNLIKKSLIAILSALIASVNYLWWMYATVHEVFPLNNLIASILLLLTLKLSSARSSRAARMIYALGILTGLALMHHQTIVLIFPGLALLLFYSRKKLIKVLTHKHVLSGIVGFLIGLLLPVLILLAIDTRASQVPQSWRIETTTQGIIHFLTRGDFSGAIFETGETTHAYFKKINSALSLQTLKHYFLVSLPSHFGLIILGLLLISWYLAYKYVPKLFASFLLMWLASGVLIAVYLVIPTQDVSISEYYLARALTERMYLLGYLSLYLPLPIGLWYLYQWLNQHVRKSLTFSQYSISVVAIPLLLLVSNYQALNLRTYTSAWEYNQTSLQSLPSDAVHICFSDLSCFGGLLAQIVEKQRPDVTIVPVTVQLRDKSLFAQNPQLRQFYYPDNPMRLVDVIGWNLHQQRPVSVSEIPENYIDLFGLEGNVAYLQPGYYYHQLTCTPTQADKLHSLPLTATMQQQITDERNSYQKHLQAVIAHSLTINGTVYARMGQKPFAERDLQAALSLLSVDQSVSDRLNSLDTYDGDPRYQEQWGCQSADQLLARANQCRLQGNPECIFNSVIQAMMAEPLNPQPRLLLAQLYLEKNAPEFAKREYFHVLQIDPHNPVALTQLENLKEIPEIQ